MNVTKVTIHKTFTEGDLKAIVSAVIDGFLRIDDLRVVQGKERLFVAMPSRRTDDGSFIDVVHPISPEAREFIERPVLNEYDNYMFQQFWDECDKLPI